jgi:hypothetical protein
VVLKDPFGTVELGIGPGGYAQEVEQAEADEVERRHPLNRLLQLLEGLAVIRSRRLDRFLDARP